MKSEADRTHIMVWIKRVVMGIVIFLVAGQLIRFPRTNPPINPAREIGASIPLKPTVAEVFNRSCNDCHSDRTVWPWYSYVAPASWLVIYDADHGRRRMNFSEWDAITPQQRKRVLDRMCSDVTNGDIAGMAVFDYPFAGKTIQHRSAGCVRLVQRGNRQPGW
jgi:Haem-binding domain